MTRSAAAAALLAVGLGMFDGAGAAPGTVEVNLEVIGRTDLGGDGPFGDVAVVGTAAIVASGSCP
ncbi:MAG: hypothetical protein M3203_03120, partial [Actinomycetota bacterium]|nr:hypothetical protein [Actinomycetota bacterium]